MLVGALVLALALVMAPVLVLMGALVVAVVLVLMGALVVLVVALVLVLVLVGALVMPMWWPSFGCGVLWSGVVVGVSLACEGLPVSLEPSYIHTHSHIVNHPNTMVTHTP